MADDFPALGEVIGLLFANSGNRDLKQNSLEIIAHRKENNYA